MFKKIVLYIYLLILFCGAREALCAEVNPRPFDETEYSIIGGRNIFTGKKEAPVIPVAPPLPEPEPVKKETVIQRVAEVENVILTGIIFLGDKYQALLEDRTTTKGLILIAGESFEGKGIKVVSVSEEKVILESGGENLEMVIERESKPGAGGPGQFPGGMYPPGFPGGAPPMAPPVTDTGRSARARRARTTSPRYTPPTGVMPGGAPGMEGAGGWMPPQGQYPPVVPGFPPYPGGGGE